MTKKIVLMFLTLGFSPASLNATIYWTMDDLDYTRSIRKITEIGEVRDENNILIHQNVYANVEYFDEIIPKKFLKLLVTQTIGVAEVTTSLFYKNVVIKTYIDSRTMINNK